MILYYPCALYIKTFIQLRHLIIAVSYATNTLISKHLCSYDTNTYVTPLIGASYATNTCSYATSAFDNIFQYSTHDIKISSFFSISKHSCSYAT